MAHVFISHAKEDLAVAVEIRDWLRGAGHQVFLASDPAQGIQLGEPWKQRLYRELRAADAIVCVVTDAYQTSEWCTAEVGIADMLGCPLLPVRAAECEMTALLKDVQFADLHADRDEARDYVLRRLAALDTVGRSGWVDGRSPYPGLKPFDADTARVFFGRTDEVRRLTGRLRSLGERADGALLAVVGPSGCGKSSLVRAGLLPTIATDPEWDTVAAFTPGTDPVAALARVLTAAANRTELGWTVEATKTKLAAGADGLVRAADEVLVAGLRPAQARLLVVVDQGEELLTRSDPARLAQFARLLGAGLAGPVRVVITLRSEFLDRLRAVPGFAGVDVEAFVLRPLGAGMLRRVVTEPAAVAGLHIDGELVDRLVADTADGDALPLLAFTLAELARGLSRGEKMPTRLYDDLGGVRGALARQAERSLAAAGKASGLESGAVLAGLVRLATLGPTGQPTRRRVPLAGMDPALRSALSVFVDNRLLVTTAEPDGTWVDLAHEALLSAWQPLADAVEARKSTLRESRAVEQAAAEWLRSGRAATHLWDGDRLAAALVALGQPGALNRTPPGRLAHLDDVDPAGREFLDAGIDAERRRARRARVFTASLAVLLVLSLVGGVTAVYQWQQADAQRRTATARGMLAEADAVRSRDPRAALQLALGAAAIDADSAPAVKTSLVTTLVGTPIRATLTGHTDWVYAVAVTADGHTAVTGGGDGTAIVWDLADGTPSRTATLTGHTGWVSAVAITDDGRSAVTGSGDGTAIVWDLADGTPSHTATLASHTGPVNAVAITPDGHTAVTGSLDGTAIVWDLADGTPSHTATLTGHTDPVNAVAITDDGRTAVTGGTDQTAIVWNLADGTPSRTATLTGHTGWVSAVAITDDGLTAVTGSSNGTAIVWDLGGANPARSTAALAGHTGSVLAAALTADGRTAVTGSLDGTAILWDLSGDTPTRTATLAEHTEPVNAVAVSDDGRTAVTGSRDQTAIVWDVSGEHPTRTVPLTGHTGPVFTAAVTDDGRVAVTGSGDQTAIVWDLAGGEPSRRATLAGHTGAVLAAAVTDDGRTAVTGSDDGTAIVWDLGGDEHTSTTLTDHTDSVYAVAVTPDGRTAVTASHDRTAVVWDLTGDVPTRTAALTDHTGPVNAVAITDDGRTAVTGSDDRTAMVWDVSGERPIRTATLGDHTDPVNTVAITDDSRTAVTGSQDRTAIVWDLSGDTPTRTATLTDHTDPVAAVAITPDGRTLITGSDDRTAIVWDSATFLDILQNLTSRACAAAGGGLGEDAWAAAAPGLDYRSTCP